MIQETFRKYIRKPLVQKGIIAEVLKKCILLTINSNTNIKCSYHNEILFISKATQEDKVQIYLQKLSIINKWQKKLLEDFAINAIIKDIRVN